MIQKSEQGVRSTEQAKLLRLNWDDFRLVADVVRHGSLRETARQMRVSVNTVREQLARIEFRLGQPIFYRSHAGVAHSELAGQIADIANNMAAIAAGPDANDADSRTVRPREIRICCSEGIGEFWLTRRLPQLQLRLPGYSITLSNEVDQDRIHSERHDVSLGFSRPTDNGRIVSRIASTHFMLYAAESYIARFGAPRSFDDAREHQFILHDAPGIREKIVDLFIGESLASQLAYIRVNTSHSLYRAVADGTGIGALPTYVRAITRHVRPLDLALQLRFDLWLSYSPLMSRSLPVRQTIEWLRESFDPRENPWFAATFVHPETFETKLRSADVVQLHEVP